MTPEHGVHFDTSSAVRSLNEKDGRDGVLPLGWFRTIIQFNKTDVNRWPEYSQSWGSTSLGSIDVALWAIALSPSNLSPDAGCILATLSSNMDLTLWTAAKNCLKGEWVKVYEVTPFLLDLFASNDGQASAAAQVLNAQIVSVAWSSQPDFGLIPSPIVDGSLLVAGSRAGSLIFLRFQPDQTIQHLFTTTVIDTWVTHLTFSSWTLVKAGTCESYLSCAASGGSVSVIKITQSIKEGSSQSGSNAELQMTVDLSPRILYQPDKTGVTALSWVESLGRGRVLAHCKPGVLHLWCEPSPSLGWSGYRSFRLPTVKLSTGSSSFHPASGLRYIRRKDVLILALFDGSFHVIHNFSREPSLVPAVDAESLTSERLSKTIRLAFSQVEQNVQYDDVNRITGLESYDGSATFFWIQEASHPSDFSYKHDAKHNSMFMTVKAWDDTDNDALIQELSEVLNHTKASAGFAPLYLLRPFLFRLRDKKVLSVLHSRVLDTIKPESPDHSTSVTVPSWTSLTPETRSQFRTSMTRNLFGWDVLLSLRMRLSLADFAWKLSENETKQNECGYIAQILLTTISHRVLRTIIRHLVASVQILTANDFPFVMRMVVQSLLPGSPPDLSEEGHRLSAIVQASLPVPAVNTFNELCPACRVEVPLQDITTAVCSNGHTWARCSITTFILSTPLVRTCIGCSRKAFLPLSTPNAPATQNWLPPAAQGWVVEELLEAVHRCLFCNNSFVNLL